MSLSADIRNCEPHFWLPQQEYALTIPMPSGVSTYSIINECVLVPDQPILPAAAIILQPNFLLNSAQE
jgi:hypothetical protein